MLGCLGIWNSRAYNRPCQLWTMRNSNRTHIGIIDRWLHFLCFSISFCSRRCTCHSRLNNFSSRGRCCLRRRSMVGIYITLVMGSRWTPVDIRTFSCWSFAQSSTGFTCSWTRTFVVLRPIHDCCCSSRSQSSGWFSLRSQQQRSWSRTSSVPCWTQTRPHTRTHCSAFNQWRFLSAGTTTAGNCS